MSIFGGNVVAQSTFSKLFNLEIGADEYTRHTLNHEGTLYVFSKHSCWDGIEYSLCVSLTKFDLDGNQLSFHVIDDFWFPSKMDVLLDKENNFVFAGHWTGPFLNRPIVILKTDHDLNIIESYEYEIEGSSSNGNFLIESATHYFVCGNRVTANNQNSYIQVLKVDKNNMEKVWLKDIFLDYHRNRGFGFSVNNDENGISFLNYVESQNEQHYILAKFDMSGEVVPSIQLDRSLDILNLLSHSNGNLYFNTPNHPDDNFIRTTLNTVEDVSYERQWSKGFPQHYSLMFGGYNISDMIECKNGDVLICGTSSDIRDEDIEQGTGAGMLMRLNADGVFKWVRYYKLRRAPEYEVDFNKNWVASLSDVYETESGGFVANGRACYVKEDPAEDLEFVFLVIVGR